MAIKTVIDTNALVSTLSTKSIYHWLVGLILDEKVYFRWDLISDHDDNKFVDCYIAAGAHYLISHDRHFNVLKSVNFPKVNVVRIEEFEVSIANTL
jgi:predicted nucleic acid-binding protein